MATCNEKRHVDIDDLDPDEREKCINEILDRHNNYSSNKTTERKIHQPEDEQITSPETPIAYAEEDDHEETEQQQDNDPSQQPESNSSLFILSYALDEMSWGVTPRGVLLLSYVDVNSNPFDENEESSPKYFSTSTLEKILQAKHRTVIRTIQDLVNRGLLTANTKNNRTWKLETPKRDRLQKGYILIIPILRSAFESGIITPIELLILGKVVSFARSKKYCFERNKQLGEHFSISEEWTRSIIRSLVVRKILKRVWVQHKGKLFRFLEPTFDVD